MQTLKFSPDEEQQLMGQMWSRHLADDPESCVFFAFPGGQENTPLCTFK